MRVTSVYYFLLMSFIALFTTTLLAQNLNQGQQSAEQVAESKRQFDINQANAEKKAVIDKCETAEKAFNDAVKELSKSNCGSLTSCAATAERCAECVGADADESGTCGYSASSSDYISASSSSSELGNMFGFPSSSGSRKTIAVLKSCPIFSKEKLKDIRENVKDYKEKMDDAEEKLAELRASAAEAESLQKEKADEIVRRQVSYQEDQTELIAERSSALQEELTQITAQIEQRLTSLKVKIEEKKVSERAVYAQCHTRMLERIEQIKTQRQERISAGRLAARSLAELSGLTSAEDRLQQEAKKLINACRNDQITKNELATIDARFKLELEVLQNEVNNLNSDFNSRVQNLQNQSQDTELQRDLKNLKRKFEEDMRDLEKERSQAERELQSLQAQISLYTKKKQEAESKYREYLEQEAATGGKTGGEMTADEFLGSVDDVQSAASAASSACSCENGTPIGGANCAKFRQADSDISGPTSGSASSGGPASTGRKQHKVPAGSTKNLEGG